MFSGEPPGFSVLVQINLAVHLIPVYGSIVNVNQMAAFDFQMTAETNGLAPDGSIDRSFGKLAPISPTQFFTRLFKEDHVLAIAMNKLNGDVPSPGNFGRLLRGNGAAKGQAQHAGQWDEPEKVVQEKLSFVRIVWAVRSVFLPDRGSRTTQDCRKERAEPGATQPI